MLSEELITEKGQNSEIGTFNAIDELSQAGIMIVDEETHEIIYVNKKTENMISQDRNSIIGKLCHEYICADVLGKCPFLDSKKENSENILLDWNGQQIPILKNTVRATVDGRKCIIDSFMDLTEMKKQDAEIRKSEDYLRDFFDNASDLIQQVDENGNIIRVNNAWCRKMGYTENEALQLNIRDIILPEHYEECMKKFKAIRFGKNYPEIETVFVCKDGSEIVLIGSINGRFENDNFVCSRGIFHDITERKKAEEILLAEKENNEKYLKIAGVLIVALDILGNVTL